MKISTFLTTVFFSFLFSHTSAQPGFNKLLDAVYDMTDMRDMVIVNDTIIGYGVGFDNPVNGKQGLVLMKFDSSGLFLQSSIITDPLGDPLSIGKTWGKIIATQDGGFAMTASVVGRNCALLIKTDNDFEVEFIKEYEDTLNLSNFRYSILEIEEGYLLYGSIQNSDLVLMPFVRKVNKLGEIIWHKYYGPLIYDEIITDLKVLNDTVILASSLLHTTFDGFGPQKSKFRKLNIDTGSTVDEWVSSPDPEMGVVINTQLLDDENFIVNAVSLVDQIGASKIVKTTISRFDKDFNLQWISRYGRSGTYSSTRWFWVIEPSKDGNFIAAGQSDVEINGKNEPSGWLMKFSAEGDSIWSRYDFPDFPVDSLGDTFFGGVGVLSSGSIVAGGTATLWNKDAIWLVKVTNDGCLDTIFCGLVPTVSPPPPKQDQLAIIPNPANASTTIHFKQPLNDERLVEFYNIQGQRVLQRDTGIGLSEVTITTIDLPEGFYFVKVGSEGAFQIGKVFISH